jgi:hypothetical protein
MMAVIKEQAELVKQLSTAMQNTKKVVRHRRPSRRFRPYNSHHRDSCHDLSLPTVQATTGIHPFGEFRDHVSMGHCLSQPTPQLQITSPHVQVPLPSIRPHQSPRLPSLVPLSSNYLQHPNHFDPFWPTEPTLDDTSLTQLLDMEHEVTAALSRRERVIKRVRIPVEFCRWIVHLQVPVVVFG